MKSNFEHSDTLPYVYSVSKTMLNVDPIIISDHPKYRILFKFEFDKESNSHLRGHFIFLRRNNENDPWPTETTYSRKNIPSPSRVDFELKSGELAALFNQTSKVKDLLENTDSSYYCAVDQLFSKDDLLILLKNNWALAQTNPELYELICNLLDGSIPDPSNILRLSSDEATAFRSLISKFGKMSEISDALSDISPQSLNLIHNASNIIGLSNIKNKIEQRLTEEHDELDWHKFISEHHLILSQLFTLPVVLFDDEAKVGGNDFHKIGGVCDYLFENKITGNISLIEIKSHTTDLVESTEYRKGIPTYATTTDLSGAVIQVNQYRTKLLNTYYEKRVESDRVFKALNPQCIVLAGTLNGLNEKQIESFELYRNSLSGTTIITYDELVARIKLIIDFITSSSNSTDTGVSNENT